MSDIAAILLAVGLLIGNAFFVGAEFALISARRTQIEPRARAGSRSARITLRAMEKVSLMLAGAQLGITICSLGLGAVGEPAVAHLIEGPFESLGVPDALIHPIALVIALAIVVGLHIVLGEMVPKNVALAGPDRVALVLGPLLYGLVIAFRPIIAGLNWLANVSLRLFRVQAKQEITSAFTRDEVYGLVEESRREGLLDQDEHELVTGALGFVDRSASSVLLPLSSLVTVTSDVTPAQVEQVCADTGYSRFPVVDAAGDPVGYLHLKDVLEQDPTRRDAPVPPKWIRPLATVSPTDALRSVLRVMQAKGAHMARVADPVTGSVMGVVALEDVLEELVGEVRDSMQSHSGVVITRPS